jgi:hypothetical protein
MALEFTKMLSPLATNIYLAYAVKIVVSIVFRGKSDRERSLSCYTCFFNTYCAFPIAEKLIHIHVPKVDSVHFVFFGDCIQ